MSDASITPDELESLLFGAQSAATAGDNDRTWELATQVREAPNATQAQQASAALLRAKASLAFGSADLAQAHLGDAESLGASLDDLAAVRGDIRRYQRGADAALDGVQGADDTRSVIASARDALARSQPEQAEQLLRSIWETTRSDPAQLAEACFEMGRALLAQHRLAEAKEYADWSAANGWADAELLQREIATMLAAEAGAADGVQVAEQRPTFEAAQAAFSRGDYEAALGLYLAVSDSPTITPGQRGTMAFNIAQCHRLLGNYDMAKAWYEEHLRVNPDSLYADEVRLKIDRMEDLAHLTEALPIT